MSSLILICDPTGEEMLGYLIREDNNNKEIHIRNDLIPRLSEHFPAHGKDVKCMTFTNLSPEKLKESVAQLPDVFRKCDPAVFETIGLFQEEN